MPMARELIALRVAESDYYSGKRKQAREALEPLLESASRGAEARLRLAAGHEGAGRSIGLHEAGAGTRQRLSRQPVGRGSAQQPRHRLHHHRQRRRCRRVFRELLRASRRAATRSARRGRSAGGPTGRASSATRPTCSTAPPHAPARRQPAGVALLVGPRARSPERTRSRPTRATGWSSRTIRTPTTAGWPRRSWRRAGEPRGRRHASRRRAVGHAVGRRADGRHHPLARRRADVRRRAARSAVRAARVGRLAAAPGDVGVDPARAGAWRCRPTSASPPSAAPSPRCAARIRSSWRPAARRCRPTCCGSSSRSTTGR